jgi:hypothetical protein
MLLYVSAFNKIDITNLLYFGTCHKNVATSRLILVIYLLLIYTVKHFKVCKPRTVV